MKGDSKKYLEDGFDDYMSIPIELETLESKTGKHLDWGDWSI